MPKQKDAHIVLHILLLETLLSDRSSSSMVIHI